MIDDFQAEGQARMFDLIKRTGMYELKILCNASSRKACGLDCSSAIVQQHKQYEIRS